MIEYLAETGSTNADLAARLRDGAANEGDWLVADRQTAGRGRQGRTWFDGAGNFMGSTVVRIAAGDPAPGSLALVAGLAVLDAVAPFLPDRAARLKWPNDVLVGEAKLAGILLERVGDAIVVGVGVNIAAAPELPDRATVSLAALGAPVTRNDFAMILAQAFAQDLDRWRTYGLEPIIRRWLAAGHPVGSPLMLHDAAGEAVHGRFAGLSPDGALQLGLPDGTTMTIHSGEVRLARP